MTDKFKSLWRAVYWPSHSFFQSIKAIPSVSLLILRTIRHPLIFLQVLKTIPYICNAHEFSRSYRNSLQGGARSNQGSDNPLWDYFQNHKDGHGLWKWEHYFEIYHRHLTKFIGHKVNMLEIGIYSGGSLEMWWSYFGKDSHIYGVDIEGACKEYESDHVSVFIGDQADRAFWANFRAAVRGLDIIIDDGGHTPEQQMITLEEMLPHLRPGGVYICEDIHGAFNRFGAFATGLTGELNRMNQIRDPLLQSTVTRFQSAIHSIHFYPYLLIVEKHSIPLPMLKAPKHGTQWQPFL